MFRKTTFLLVLLCIATLSMAQKKSVTIDCGGLEKALAGDYSFTTLVVNGSMDVRDFACINDNVMTLESIDLSGCTIQSYDSRDEQYLGAHSHFVAGEIPPSAFLGFPNLTTVVLPSSLRSIGEGAFAGCESLVSVKNGSSIEQIGNFSFSGCASLCEMELPATLRSIGDYAFDKCASLAQIDLSGCKQLTRIGVRAFAQNTELAVVKLPAGLTTLQDAAFAGCSKLTSVELPATLRTMGEGVFAACTQLQSVDMSQCEIVSLSPWTFSSCTLLSDVVLPQSLTSIGEGAFGGCISLQTIALPASVGALHDFAFAGCSALKALDFMPVGVETIGRYTFYCNTSATQTVIPPTVSHIDDHAFDGCISSGNFYSFRELPADLGEMVFANMDVEKKTLHVLTESLPIYESAPQWADFGKINPATAVDEVENDRRVKVVFEDYNLRVEASQELQDLYLFDISGVALYVAQPRACEAVIDTRSFAHNIYVLKLITADGVETILKVARVIR